MRISTFQFYQANTLNIMDKQSQVNNSIIHMSEGKRVITAGDDSVAANSIINYKQEVRVTEQYQRNIDFADARLLNEEASLTSVEGLLERIKVLTLQGNNAATGPLDRESIAEELEGRFEELLSIANTRDEAGNYIFGGFQTDRLPFAKQPDGSVQYYGDDGQRETTVGSNVTVITNDPGSGLFMDIPNSVGDFRPVYDSNNTGLAYVESAIIADPGEYDPVSMPPGYTIDFVDLDGDDNAEYQVFDANGVQVEPTPAGTSTPYASGDEISFNGVEMVINGEPDIGDSVTMEFQQTKDIFSVVQAAIDWMRAPQDTDIERNQLQVEIGHIISDLNQVSNHVTSVRANVGARMQVVSSQDNINEDYLLTVKTTQSSLEDLDIAEATMEYSQQRLALQAAQQSFAQVQSLTLFQYI